MRSDDLVPMLKPAPGPAVGFRQGLVVSWDPDTAENTVLVGRSLMTNLPILNTSEAAILTAGDVVGILTAGQTWGILGRFTYPGTPEAVTSIQSVTSRIRSAEDVTGGFLNSTSWGDLTGTDPGPSVTIRIGSSGRALVFWACEIGQTAAFQYRNTPHAGIEVSGATSIAANEWNALNFALEFPTAAFAGTATPTFWLQAGTQHTFTGLNPGMTTFTMKYRHDGQNPAGAVNFQAREIAVFAL